jgi:hypothetical protein
LGHLGEMFLLSISVAEWFFCLGRAFLFWFGSTERSFTWNQVFVLSLFANFVYSLVYKNRVPGSDDRKFDPWSMTRILFIAGRGLNALPPEVYITALVCSCNQVSLLLDRFKSKFTFGDD